MGGGAYFNDGGSLTIRNSTLDENTLSVTGTATDSGGGAVFHDGGDFSLLDSTLTGNAASPLTGASNDGGGAILYDGGAGTFTNDTIAANSTDTTGGSVASYPTITFRNTIVSGGSAATGANCSPLGAGAFASAGHNLEGADTCALHGAGDHPNTNPLLEPLASNGGPTRTMAIPLRSPAVDRGASSALTADQRGKPRPFDFLRIPNGIDGDGSDIGAFELRPSDISNAFTFRKLKRNKLKGVAVLTVKVPGSGTLVLFGLRVKKVTRQVGVAGAVKLQITLKGKAKKKLINRHHVRVKIGVTFTPTGGLPKTRSERIKLVKR